MVRAQTPQKLIDEKGIRVDGRSPYDLRPIKLEVGVLGNANGSAYIEQGKNKILVAVYGPREVHPKHLALPDRATIRCRYHMAPFSVEDRKSPAPSRRELELSKIIREALEPSVFAELYPRTTIDVFIEVLDSDGGTRGAGITAASLALADAGIPLKDLVVGCASGKVEDRIVLDLNDIEDKSGQADMPVALLPRTSELTLLQMDGMFSSEEFEEALKLTVEGCRQIHAMQREALRQKYAAVKEVAEEEAVESETEKKEEAVESETEKKEEAK